MTIVSQGRHPLFCSLLRASMGIEALVNDFCAAARGLVGPCQGLERHARMRRLMLAARVASSVLGLDFHFQPARSMLRGTNLRTAREGWRDGRGGRDGEFA
jgi:hypothetical protein